MSVLKLTVLEVMAVPKRNVVVATVVVAPAHLTVPASATFRDPQGGRWQVAALANTDVPPPAGQEMLALSPVGGQGSLKEGMELDQEL